MYNSEWGAKGRHSLLRLWHLVISKNRNTWHTFIVFHHCHLMSYDVAVCKSVCKNARYISLRERACGASVRYQSARNGERCVYWSWYCEPDVKDRRALCANVIWIVNMCLLYNKYLQLNNSRLLYILPPSFHPYTHHPFHQLDGNLNKL